MANPPYPLVSVVMPTYNAMPYLKQAVESILGQTYTNIEFLIYNDCSTDDTQQYLDSVQDPRVRIIHSAKCGYVALLNRGLEEARGVYVARMDADDISHPDRLAKQIAYLCSHPDVVVCGCQIKMIDEQGNSIGLGDYPVSHTEIQYKLLLDTAFSHPGVVYSLEAVRRVGAYDLSKCPAEDYDLWCRLSRVGQCVNLTDILLHYRMHGKNVSITQRISQRRIAEEISITFLQTTGYAESAEQAKLFRSIALNPATNIDRSGMDAYITITRKYLDGIPENQADMERLINSLRWNLLRGASLAGVLSIRYYRWLILAREVDPKGMRFSRLLVKLLLRIVKPSRKSSQTC